LNDSTSIHTSDRMCTICKTGDVENENHFLFKCEKYSNYKHFKATELFIIINTNRNSVLAQTQLQ
jgi:hypothetical protein